MRQKRNGEYPEGLFIKHVAFFILSEIRSLPQHVFDSYGVRYIDNDDVDTDQFIGRVRMYCETKKKLNTLNAYL